MKNWSEFSFFILLSMLSVERTVMERHFKLACDWATTVQRIYYMVSQCGMQKDRGHVKPWYAYNKYTNMCI